MSSNNPERRFNSLASYARYKDVSERTVRRWVGLGHFPAYRAEGRAGLIIDFDEADRLLAQLPEGQIKPQGIYGPHADIRPLPTGGAQ